MASNAGKIKYGVHRSFAALEDITRRDDRHSDSRESYLRACKKCARAEGKREAMRQYLESE